MIVEQYVVMRYQKYFSMASDYRDSERVIDTKRNCAFKDTVACRPKKFMKAPVSHYRFALNV